MRRVAVLLASMLFLLTTTGSASAHADLVSMSPEPGSTVSDTITRMTLTFGEELTAIGSSVVVIDPNGNAVQLGVTFQGPTASVALGDFLVAGEYHVNFRVNSVDGHIVEGSEVFTYAGPIATPTAVATLTGVGDDDAGGAEQDEAGSGMIGLGLIAVIAIGAIVYGVSSISTRNRN